MRQVPSMRLGLVTHPQQQHDYQFRILSLDQPWRFCIKSSLVAFSFLLTFFIPRLPIIDCYICQQRGVNVGGEQALNAAQILHSIDDPLTHHQVEGDTNSQPHEKIHHSVQLSQRSMAARSSLNFLMAVLYQILIIFST